MSVLNLEHNFLFIHVPRTAGSSMEQAPFINYVHGHIPYVQYELVVGKGVKGIELSDLFSFAFVRHPIDRFVSGFEYARIRNALRQDDTIDDVCSVMEDIKPMEIMTAEINQDQGILRSVPQGPLFDGMLFNLFMPQAFFIINYEMKVGVDFLGRFENVQADWKEVCDTIGVKPFSLPHLKKTDHKSEVSEYAQAVLQKFYAVDFKMLGYDYDTKNS